MPTGYATLQSERVHQIHTKQGPHRESLLQSYWQAHAGGGNFSCPIPGPQSAAPEDGALAEIEDDLSRAIVDCEVNSSAWTLMHRYNKATELIDSVLNVSHPLLKLLHNEAMS